MTVHGADYGVLLFIMNIAHIYGTKKSDSSEIHYPVYKRRLEVFMYAFMKLCGLQKSALQMQLSYLPEGFT